MTMDLFTFPIEIRLKIYSELLVHHGPIDFSVPFWGNLSSRLCPKGTGIYPTLLRASKQVYGEAISLLYSDNCFRLTDPDAASTRRPTAIPAFVRQIGAQARLLRHVCIDFPTVRLTEDPEHDYEPQEENFDILDLIRETCPGITTLELLLPSERADFVLRDLSVFTELLDLLQTRLEAFQSLQEVRVDVKLLGWDSDEQSDDVADDSEDVELEDPRDNRWKTRRDSLRELCSRGWAVDIIKIPLEKEIWTSPDDSFEFDNEDDYNNYMSAWNRLKQVREYEEWEEYYRQKQIEIL
jgi:hypothetical protein